MELYNRYGYKVSLRKMKNIEQYKLIIQKEINFCIRYGGISDKSLDFVDPSGGPFLHEGYLLPNKKVITAIERTDKGIFITAK